MLRNTLLLAVCCVMFALGCSKKEEQQAPAPATGHAAKAPAGLAVLSESPTLFMTKNPVTVAQYVQYLKDSGQAVPDSMQAAALGGPGGQAPVTGLTRKEAENYAIWDLKRLPTAQEWAMATRLVGSAPYPWAVQDENIPVAASVYLVQDWLPGSAIEKQAEARRQALAGELQKERAAGFEQARKALDDLVTQQKAAAQQRWDQFKLPFFSLVDKQKQLAEATAQKKARQEMAQILEEAFKAKYKLASLITLGDDGAQAAAKTYTNDLAQWRTAAQNASQTLEQSAKDLQAQVRQKNDAFDQLGPKAIADRFAEADALLAQSAQAPADPKDAAALQGKLVATTQKLQDAKPLFDALPDADSLNAEAAKVQKEIDAAKADTAAADRVAKLKDDIQGLTQKVNQDFLDENLLLKDLDSLVELRARRDAVQANLAALTGVMRQVSIPEATATAASATAASAATTPAAPAPMTPAP